MRFRQYYVYILASRPHGAIYMGVTSDLALRISEHQSGQIDGHAKRYNIKNLVYYELFDAINDAIAFEKKLKRWRRAWKDELIEKDNPEWADLSGEIGMLGKWR
ncbi:MAG: GIY-YIG nuclease family protein [Alphaproteobacteria bacterium]